MPTLKRSLTLIAILLVSGFIVRQCRALQRIRAGGDATIASRLDEFGPTVRQRLEPDFQQAGVQFPPARVVLVALKEERKMEVYAAEPAKPLKFIRAYPIQAASGNLGPKLREGDFQVPEGLYQIEYLNPNSSYHLSIKIDYPNAFDRLHGIGDGRLQLGGDIMIHGYSASAGCLAMGNEAAEDLFVLTALTGIKNVSVILSPVDFRTRELPPLPSEAPPLPAWTDLLYPKIKEELKKLPDPPRNITQ